MSSTILNTQPTGVREKLSNFLQENGVAITERIKRKIRITRYLQGLTLLAASIYLYTHGYTSPWIIGLGAIGVFKLF